MSAERGPLADLVVLDLTGNVATAFTTVLLADLGAEVITVEPPFGCMVRGMRAAPFYLRGKKSVVLDLHDPSDLAVAVGLASGADVVIEAFGAGAADRLGVGYDELAETNPGLVYASITGFGHSGPFAHLKAYEAVVMAKTGSMYGNLPGRAGAPVMTIPIGATYSAALLAQQGIFVALHERAGHGHGQRVDATMGQGMLAHDPWSHFLRMLAARYPDAFTPVGAPSPDRPVPTTWLSFGLLNGYSKDGRWMQFAHATPRQFDAFLRVLGLAPLLETPEWRDAPNHQDTDVRDRWWTMMLEAIRTRTIDEWQAVFDTEPNVFAEIYRRHLELFEHPQIVHDHHAVTVDDAERGPVRQMGTLVQLSRTPPDPDRTMPGLDADGAELRARPTPKQLLPEGEPPVGRPPLEGITVVDLGTFYAGPFGSTMLADQGARVIKIEPIGGDPIRFQMPMPESSAVRVTQGKESIAVDAFSEEGKKIVVELVKKADVVLHCYRGGVAERMGVDFDHIVEVNPEVIYHHGVGYGIDGPYCRRPAFAPTIAAGSGFAERSGGGGTEGVELTIDEIKMASLRLAGVQSGHPDGFAALGVGMALSLDVYLRDLGHGGQTSLTSMLSTMGHVMCDAMVDFAGAPAAPMTDPDSYGFSPQYRLYPAAEDGWVVLCAPTDHAWDKLVRSVPDDQRRRDLEGERFATAESRAASAAALVDVLTAMFVTRPALEWEALLSAAGVGCAAVAPSNGALAVGMFDPGDVAEQCGWLTSVVHPLFDEHPRTTELVQLSRSGSVLGPGEQIGGHTKAILRELGYDEAAIEALRDAGIVGWP
jgi:crotonobetainyl-CoA:carnitine CoA-transferase CaiB-like acyl-CoA transferase